MELVFSCVWYVRRDLLSVEWVVVRVCCLTHTSSNGLPSTNATQ